MISGRSFANLAIILMALALASETALAQQALPAFTKIVLFGDSLSDTGNVRARTSAKSSGAIDYPSHTFNYDNGRFTNDTDTDPGSNTYLGVWHEQLARTFLGLPAATNSLGGSGGLNYAFGGATTMDGTHQEVEETPVADITITIDDMGKQMDDYLAAQVVDPNALYIVWGGSNDLRNDDSAASVTDSAARATALVSRLANAGAQYLMVPNVAPLGDVPRYADNEDTIAAKNKASADYRDQLAANLASLQASLALQGLTPTIYQVDEWADVVRVFSNGPRFGFTNLTDPCQDTSGPADQYIFWDDKHPTTAAHFRIAKTAFDTMVNPPPAPSKALNISTRMPVETGERVSIAGFIVTGDIAKKVLIRGIGPSLVANGVPAPLSNPTLTLFDSAGNVDMANDDWKDSPDAAEIMSTGLAPSDDREAAIIATVAPGLHTAQLAGKDGGTGNGVIEVYDLDQTHAVLANLSTRGYVGTGDNVLIGGVTIGNGESPIMVFRALGPSLASFGIAEPLLNPVLDVYDSNGNSIAFNDDWKLPQRQAVRAVNLAPSDDREAAIVLAFLSPGQYTAIVRGKNETTGVAIVEAFRIQ